MEKRILKVFALTEEQAKALRGQRHRDGYFNPCQDANGHWFISKEEIESSEGEEFSWVRKLSEIDYKPAKFKFP
jgi:hypothetical protein